jgi:hypothetical protein
MIVKVEGNELVIRIPMGTPTPSASGKSLVVASTRGNAVTDCQIQGKPVTIGLNAYIPRS